MVGWIEVLAGWFEPVVGVMKQELLAGGYLQADETVIRYLDRDDPGKSHSVISGSMGEPATMFSLTGARAGVLNIPASSWRVTRGFSSVTGTECIPLWARPWA
jgi:hypothetical protein